MSICTRGSTSSGECEIESRESSTGVSLGPSWSLDGAGTGPDLSDFLALMLLSYHSCAALVNNFFCLLNSFYTKLLILKYHFKKAFCPKTLQHPGYPDYEPAGKRKFRDAKNDHFPPNQLPPKNSSATNSRFCHGRDRYGQNRAPISKKRLIQKPLRRFYYLGHLPSGRKKFSGSKRLFLMQSKPL